MFFFYPTYGNLIRNNETTLINSQEKKKQLFFLSHFSTMYTFGEVDHDYKDALDLKHKATGPIAKDHNVKQSKEEKK